MNSSQAKIGRKRLRKIEIKIIVPFRFYPMRNRKFQKRSKKIGWKRMRNTENKNFRSVSFLLDA